MHERSSRKRKKMRVFITDDSKIVVERLADLLKDVAGVEVVGQAGDALQAILSIRQGHPRLKVLICTNFPYPQYRDECLAAGANYFLDKSADFDKIPAIFRQLIRTISPETRL